VRRDPRVEVELGSEGDLDDGASRAVSAQFADGESGQGNFLPAISSTDVQALAALSQAAAMHASPLEGRELQSATSTNRMTPPQTDKNTPDDAQINERNTTGFSHPAVEGLGSINIGDENTREGAFGIEILSPPTSSLAHLEGSWQSTTNLDHFSIIGSVDASYDPVGLDIWNPNFDVADWMTLDSPYAIDLYAPSTLISHDTTHADGNQFQNIFNSSTDPLGTGLPVNNPRESTARDTQRSNANMPAHTDDRHRFGQAPPLFARSPQGFASSQQARSARPEKMAPSWPTEWNPVQSDNILSFPDLHETPVVVFEAENFAHTGRLSSARYKEILDCFVQSNQGQNLFVHSRNSFPSLEAMNCFIQLYFEYFQPVYPLLHQPSFDPTSSPYVLILAVAAIGCRYSKIPGSQKCAIALQELLRRAIMRSVRVYCLYSFHCTNFLMYLVRIG
jgi:hypothetical protein